MTDTTQDELLGGVFDIPLSLYNESREKLKQATSVQLSTNSDTYNTTFTQGFWRDVIERNGKIVEISEVHSNLVVNTFALLVAAWARGNGVGTGNFVDASSVTWYGIQYMELGTGLTSWDIGGNPAPTVGVTGLVTPLARTAVTVGFVNPNTTPPTASTTPQSAVLVQATFPTGIANGYLREWGLFGGNATSTLATGTAVDYVTSSALQKPSGVNDFSLTRQVTLIF